jgi:antitoxin (DNA-binding transcriptional repressor) of toxin-antitoxin stability system
LKERTSEIVREVREQRAEYVITHRGRAVARLVPTERAVPSQADIDAYFAEWDAFTAEIAERWPEGVSLEDAMRDIRREL